MRVQSPIAGAMTGSAGNITFQHYNGRTYGRSKPVIFHYGPTPAQAANQTKYYGIRTQWNPLYREIKPYIPENQLKQTNAFNQLSDGVFKALGTFQTDEQPEPLRKFGFDVFDRLVLRLGNYDLYYQEPFYYITFYDFDYQSAVDFIPTFAHALYLCPDLQQVQYNLVDFNADHLTFIFVNSRNWFPDHTFEMYVALSDDEYFSNFFY